MNRPATRNGGDAPGEPNESRLPAHVTAAKAALAAAREEIRGAHDRGLDAVQVCSRLTAAADAAVGTLWQAALADAETADASSLEQNVTLVAHGGYGRRQLAPLSDVDLMVLYGPRGQAAAEWLSRRLTAELFDIGIEVGHSLRSHDEALQLARRDTVVATSLLESRRLFGSPALYERFADAFRSSIQRRGAVISAEFAEARRQERERYGETVYLLEPNVKRSRGALRDVHLLRWLWFVQHGVSDLDRLRTLGALSKIDHHRLTSARNFLLRVRNQLHFDSPRGGDALHRQEQLRIAERFGYSDGEGILSVERFMRDYFRHAGFVWFLTRRLTDLTTRRRSLATAIEPVLSKSITKDYRVGFSEINATEQGRRRLARDTAEVLRLLELARDHDKRIAQETWYTVYRAAHKLPADLSEEAAERFLQALGVREGLGLYLRRLHELTVMDRVIPAFRDARCLLQFNQYHKFTVDEHSLRAVEAAVAFTDRSDALGGACRNVPNPALLHLALLLHDLGKAHDGDHSVVGEQIAVETGKRLRLEEDQTRRIAWLVRHHLTMSHLAFRRDTSTPGVVDDFARLVGDAENLAMLFVLTCADMAAVGPGVLNDWKVSVLADLHDRTLEALSNDTKRVEDRRNARRMATWQLLSPHERDRSDLKELFTSLPESYLATRSPNALSGALRRLARVAAKAAPPSDSVGRVGVDAWGGYHRDETTLELTAAVADGAGRGVFSSMAGALSSKGLRILTAETAQVAQGVLLLRYTADDPRPAGNAAEANRRVKGIATAMVHSVDSDAPPQIPQVWGAERAAESAALSAMPSEVRIDTSLSDECVIIEVFTIDRAGLLYHLARTLHELGLVIRFAKIATSLDQVVDVFYVTGRDGEKPADEARLTEVSRRLMDVIERES